MWSWLTSVESSVEWKPEEEGQNRLKYPEHGQVGINPYLGLHDHALVYPNHLMLSRQCLYMCLHHLEEWYAWEDTVGVEALGQRWLTGSTSHHHWTYPLAPTQDHPMLSRQCLYSARGEDAFRSPTQDHPHKARVPILRVSFRPQSPISWASPPIISP